MSAGVKKAVVINKANDGSGISSALNALPPDHYEKLMFHIGNVSGDQKATDEVAQGIPYYEADRSFEKFSEVMDLYQEQPHLLDPKLESLLTPLLNNIRKTYKAKSPADAIQDRSLQLSFRFIEHISKVRGYKVMLRLLPHEVSDLEPVLALLEAIDPKNLILWACRNVLLLWLLILCKMPFELSKFDGGNGGASMSERLLSVASRYVYSAETCRVFACRLRAELVTRTDLKHDHLIPELNQLLSELKSTNYDNLKEVLHKTSGLCMILAYILKHGKRVDIEPEASSLLTRILDIPLEELDNTLLKKMKVKIVQRIGLIFLKPRVTAWRYNRGNRCLADNLKPKASVVITNEPKRGETEEEEENYDIPEDLETVIEYLLTMLKDSKNFVRWSSSKGLGRITARLPKELADEVISSILECFSAQESDSSWHGGCLALAELGIRGYLLPSKLNEVIPVVLKALVYETSAGRFSVGGHVRDAACYLSWSFARTYSPEEMKPYVNRLAAALVSVAIFDREINCRRAASAAFQENVGRQGSFPYGIEILTMCDYFAVGQMKHCYRELSVFVAGFSMYAEPLVMHLLDHKIGHWDPEIRSLTAEALGKLTPLVPELICDKVLPKLYPMALGRDLFRRQGALFCIGNIIHALQKIADSNGKTYITPEIMKEVSEIPGQIVERKLLRGIGAEWIRDGVNRFMKLLADAEPPKWQIPSLTLLLEWIAMIEDNLKNRDEKIRIGAAAVWTPLCLQFDRLDPDGSERKRIITECLSQLETGIGENERMGAALALGRMRFDFIGAENAGSVMKRLSKVATEISESDKSWAEARRDSIHALGAIHMKLRLEGKATLEESETAFKTFMIGVEEYTIDTRGDIGRVVREEAMRQIVAFFCPISNEREGLEYLYEKMAAGNEKKEMEAEATGVEAAKWIGDEAGDRMLYDAVCCLIQQTCEKIDLTRKIAAESLQQILTKAPEVLVQKLPKIKLLHQIFVRKQGREKGNFSTSFEVKWMSARESFPLLAKLFKHDEYRIPAVTGIIVSAGGMTESTKLAAQRALLDYLKSVIDDETILKQFLSSLTSIFKSHIKLDRITSPMLVTLDQILSSGYVEQFVGRADEIPELRQLLELSIQVSHRKKHPSKVLAGVNVCCGYLQFETTSWVWERALRQCLNTLTHIYPAVRRGTANQLYEALLTYACLDNHNEIVMSMLSETDWAREIAELKETKLEIASRLGIKLSSNTSADKKCTASNRSSAVAATSGGDN